MTARLSPQDLQPAADLIEQIQDIRQALRDLDGADEDARYKVRVYQQWGRDSLVASVFPLPLCVVVAGLQAMERVLVERLAKE